VHSWWMYNDSNRLNGLYWSVQWQSTPPVSSAYSSCAQVCVRPLPESHLYASIMGCDHRKIRRVLASEILLITLSLRESWYANIIRYRYQSSVLAIEIPPSTVYKLERKNCSCHCSLTSQGPFGNPDMSSDSRVRHFRPSPSAYDL
jgi:hypothetical protein